MPPAPSDALYRSGFYESLKRRVRPLAPPDGGKPFSWFLEKVLSFAFYSFLAIAGCSIISLVGRASPKATAAMLVIALCISRSSLESPRRTNGIVVLNHHPFSAGQKHRWFWQQEAWLYQIAGGLALLTAVLWFVWARAFNRVPVAFLSVAGALVWVNAAAVMALLRYLPKSSRALLPVMLVVAAGFSDDLAPLRLLNPAYWPLLAVECADTAAGWTAAAGALIFPIFVRLLVRWRAKEISARLTTPAAEESQVKSAAVPVMAAAPGFWERLIYRSRTPQEQLLAEFCSKPGAVSLGRAFSWSALVGAVLLVLSLALIPWLLKAGLNVKDPMSFQTFFPLLLVLAVCVTMPGGMDSAQDGFPFGRLTDPRTMPDGNRVLPAALLPVRMRTIWLLWLKSLWPRLLMLTCLLAAAALVSGWRMEKWALAVHSAEHEPTIMSLSRMQDTDRNLKPLFAVLIYTPVWFCLFQAAFVRQLLTTGTVWRRYSLRWLARGGALAIGFLGAVWVLLSTMNTLPAAALEDSPGRFAIRIAWLCLPLILGTLLMTAVYRFGRPDHWGK